MRGVFRAFACFAIGLWYLTGSITVAQELPALRGVAPQAPAPSVVPAIVPTAVESVAVPVAAPSAEISIGGQIARIKQVEVRPAGDKVIALFVDTGNGQHQIVDVGPALNWRSHTLRVGEQINVRGPVVTLGDARVLLASEVYAGAEIFPITRVAATAAPVAVAAAGYPVADQMVKVDGRIEALRTVALAGKPGEHLLADIVNRRGEMQVVDLGPPAALWRADLKQNDSIRVEGQQMSINNRPMLLALQINKNGLPYMIDRDVVHQGPAVVVP